MAQITVTNRTTAEIILFADVVKDTKATTDKPAQKTLVPVETKYTAKNRGTGENDTKKSRTIVLPGMRKGSFSPNPVRMDADVWAGLAKQSAVASMLRAGHLEVTA